jgi:hypothetical protein
VIIADTPVLYYAELDAERWETRKVEVLANGALTYASASEESGACLAQVQTPLLKEIAKNPEFRPVAITKDELELLWTHRTSNASTDRRLAQLLRKVGWRPT